jgi:hypothetical protein
MMQLVQVLQTAQYRTPGMTQWKGCQPTSNTATPDTPQLARLQQITIFWRNFLYTRR